MFGVGIVLVEALSANHAFAYLVEGQGCTIDEAEARDKLRELGSGSSPYSKFG